MHPSPSLQSQRRIHQQHIPSLSHQTWHSILHQPSSPDTLEQNPVVKCFNHTMLLWSCLPHKVSSSFIGGEVIVSPFRCRHLLLRMCLNDCSLLHQWHVL